jgi:collagenase-like PrtC family protease
MIATALALQDATSDAVIDISTMMLAKSIYNSRLEMTDEEFSEALFNYSAHLASVTATLVTNAVMTEAQVEELLKTIHEMDTMGKDVK